MNCLCEERTSEQQRGSTQPAHTRDREISGNVLYVWKKVAEHIFFWSCWLDSTTTPPSFNYTYFVEHSTTFFISKISATICAKAAERAHPSAFKILDPCGQEDLANWLLDRKCVLIVFRRRKKKHTTKCKRRRHLFLNNKLITHERTTNWKCQERKKSTTTTTTTKPSTVN